MEKLANKLSKGLLILLSIGSTVVLCVVSFEALWLVPQFVELFKEFGGEIPFITKAVINSHYYWVVFPVMTMIVGVDIVRRGELGAQYVVFSEGLFIGGFLLALALLILSVWAAYGPILELPESP